MHLKTTRLATLLAVPLLIIGGVAAPAAASVSGVTIFGPINPLIGVASNPATFKSDGYGDLPVKYEYWVNGGTHKTVKADKTGQAIVYLTFTTNFNSLTVEGIGADGVPGYTNELNINAQGAIPAKVNDSNGDGVPDRRLGHAHAQLPERWARLLHRSAW